jgi:hypothetical protein
MVGGSNPFRGTQLTWQRYFFVLCYSDILRSFPSSHRDLVLFCANCYVRKVSHRNARMRRGFAGNSGAGIDSKVITLHAYW